MDHDNDFYKTNKCLDKANLFVLCVKTNVSRENKCKNLFDKWYKCILTETLLHNKNKHYK
jgi:hypothetical protein